MIVSDEILIQAVEAVQQHATKQAAADSLGWSRETLRDRYRQAVRRNLTGDALGGILPEGYVMGKVTSLVGPDGTVLEWQHKLPDALRMEELFEHLEEVFKREIVPLPSLPWNDLMPTVDTWLTLYPIVDAHLGQYSWGKQSGENYDMDIAKDQFLRSTTSLMQLTPASSTALIIVLGDYFHADNDRAETERSHNHRTKKGPLSDEKNGAIWEIIPAFTAKDAWNRSMGHSSQRSIQAITFDKKEGRKFTTYVNIADGNGK